MEKGNNVKGNNKGNKDELKNSSSSVLKDGLNIGLIIKDEKNNYLGDFKDKIKSFSDNFSVFLRKYDEENNINVVSTFEEKDSVYINKINGSHLHYMFKVDAKCVAILSLDYFSVKIFIEMLLGLKISKHQEEALSIAEITKIEKSLLMLIVDMACDSLKISFNIPQMSSKHVEDLTSYVLEKNIIVTEMSLGNSKSSVALILYYDFLQKFCVVNDNGLGAKYMQNNVENLNVDVRFLTNKKKITLDFLNNLKVEDVIMFDNKVNIVVNNNEIGFGEIGHIGENVAVMCANFNKD